MADELPPALLGASAELPRWAPHPDAEALPLPSMLFREAHAWAALLQLHGSVLQTAATATAGPDALTYDDTAELATQREAGYVAALSQLAAQCDALHVEALRARAMRRARAAVGAAALAEITRAHTQETTALGTETAKSLGLELGARAAELRASVTRLRGEISQLRTLLQALHEHQQLQLPADATLVVGLRRGDGRTALQEIEPFLASAYRQTAVGGDLTLDAVAAALAHAPPAPRATANRHFARRAPADRAPPPAAGP